MEHQPNKKYGRSGGSKKSSQKAPSGPMKKVFSKAKFIKNSGESDITKADPDDYVVLSRGIRTAQMAQVIKNKSAGGNPPNPNVHQEKDKETRESEARKYVEFESAPWASAKDLKQSGGAADNVEFTTDFGLSEHHGSAWDRGVIQIRIQKKYLHKGSATEAGWLADKSAPIQVVAYMYKKPA